MLIAHDTASVLLYEYVDIADAVWTRCQLHKSETFELYHQSLSHALQDL